MTLHDDLDEFAEYIILMARHLNFVDECYFVFILLINLLS